MAQNQILIEQKEYLCRTHVVSLGSIFNCFLHTFLFPLYIWSKLITENPKLNKSFPIAWSMNLNHHKNYSRMQIFKQKWKLWRKFELGNLNKRKRIIKKILPRIWRSMLRHSWRSLRCQSLNCCCGFGFGFIIFIIFSIFLFYFSFIFIFWKVGAFDEEPNLRCLPALFYQEDDDKFKIIPKNKKERKENLVWV